MAEDGLDALLLTCPADVFYVSGFLTRFWESPARPWFLIVPAAGDPIAVIPAIGAPLMARSWITDIRTWEAPDPEDDGVSLLEQSLSEAVPQTGAIGIPMGAETHLRMPLADFRRLSDRLAPRRIADATAVVRRVREIKSEAEIAKIRTVCHLAGQAFDAVPGWATAGMGVDAVFRRFQGALLEAGADWVAYLAGAAAPGGYSDVISPAPADPLRAGDILMLDTGAVRDGYFCDFDRNYSVGQPSDPVRRAQEALWHVTQDTLAALRPGLTARDLHRQMHDGLVRRGLSPGGGRFGHGLGLTLTEWPSLSDKDSTPLRTGMVLTLEPSVIVTPGRMLVHEENLVLRDHGAELLSPRAPQTLPEIPP